MNSLSIAKIPILFVIFSIFILFELTYTGVYALFLLLCITLLSRSNHNSNVFSIFCFVYFGIGLLNISTLRGTVSLESIQIIFIYLSSLLLPLVFFHRKKIDSLSHELHISVYGYFFLVIHIILAYLVLIFIYVKIGNVFFNQSLRLNVPVWAGYVVRSILIIPLVITVLSNSKYPLFKNKKIIYLLCYCPCILIGARGTAITFLLSQLLLFILLQEGFKSSIQLHTDDFKRKLRKRNVIGLGLFIFTIVVSGFYLRRTGGSIYASPQELIDLYFSVDSIWLYLIMPFYFAFRETVGITNTIIVNSITNVELIPLFVADIFTVLPGDYKAAGQSLGDLVGRVGSGGLTPGIIGGLYIDFGMSGVFFVSIISFFLGYSFYKSGGSKRYCVIYSIFIFQYIHLIHRGFLKPEYLTFIIIATFYLLFLSKE
ncbi:hypothetical protein MTsN2n4_28670 [Pseudoalteromonas sp. MTN2-4]